MMLSFLTICFLLSGFSCPIDAQSDIAATEVSPLPGRIGNDSIYYTCFGKTYLFFYMTPNKDMLARQLVCDVNEKSLMSFGYAAQPCPTSGILTLNGKYPNPIGVDSIGNSLYVDPEGHNMVSTYTDSVVSILKNKLGINVERSSCSINLNLNFDALKIHRESFSDHYEYLSKLPLSTHPLYLFQDLTLIDWQMAKGTCAATLVQDGENGDRFLMVYFPGEVVGTVFTEPYVSLGSDKPILLSDRNIFPYNSAVAPFDFYGSTTVGSWKGKIISTSTRGIVLEQEIEQAVEKATFLPINRPLITVGSNQLKTYEYQDKIKVQDLLEEIPKENVFFHQKQEDHENLTILESSPLDYAGTINHLRKSLGFVEPVLRVLHLIKRDGGFSQFNKLNLNIAANSKVIILNRSKLPENYKYYTVSKDWTNQGLPWVQLFNFTPKQVMIVSGETFLELSMSPLEELFYRNAQLDDVNPEASVLMKKLVSELEIYILN